MSGDRNNSGSVWSVLGWAVYLACSWTWCIGMFLPTLLVRDFGVWGFLVFALPNVVGAAAMGWVLASAGDAERIVRQHRGVSALFASVTIAFHLFFLQWIGTHITGVWWMLAIAATPIAATLGLRASNTTLWRAAALAWGVSVATMVVVVGDRDSGEDWAVPAVGPTLDLMLLAPVCVFGFMLCPYLDPTFLRARRSMGHGQAQAAFALGFVVFFAAMIALTLVYAPLFPGRAGEPAFAAGLIGATAVGLLAVHFAVQTLFTVSVHAKEGLPLHAPLVLTVPLVGLLAGLPAFHGWDVGGMPSHEVVYRVFLSFYGLVFPAYVWLCMIPTRDGHAGLGGARGQLKLRVWCGAVGVAAPFYWMGFVAMEELFLVPGLAIVLAARLAVRGRGARWIRRGG